MDTNRLPHFLQCAFWDLSSDTRAEEQRALLNNQERTRADRFYHQKHRTRFTNARAGMRQRLGLHLNRDPRSIRFEVGPHGKLFVPEGVSFNLSHSSDWAALVIADRPVGIDIECHRHVRDIDMLARKVFCDEEVDEFLGCDPGCRRLAFFTGWVAKEALIKADGRGISMGLKNIRISLLKHDPYRAEVRLPDTGTWTIHPLTAPEGFSAALCY